MSDIPVCWKCGASIEDLPQPPGRFAECDACHAELHVCRQCRFYDTAKAKHCAEPVAEEVKDKTRANFCDYFQLRPDAFTPADNTAAAAAQAELAALFGLDASGGDGDKGETEAERARAQWEALFGNKDER